MATSALVNSPVFNVSTAFSKPSVASSTGKFSSVSFPKVEFSARRQMKCNAEKDSYSDDAAKIATNITEDTKTNVAAGIDAAEKQNEELKGEAEKFAAEAGKKAEEAKEAIFGAAGDTNEKAADAQQSVVDKAKEIGKAVGDKAEAIKDAASK